MGAAKRFLSYLVDLIATLVLVALIWLGINVLIGLFGQQNKVVLQVLSIAGGSGGLLFALIQNERKFMLSHVSPRHSNFELGSVSDIAIGIGSAYGIMFVFIGWVKLEAQLESLLRLFALGLLAGIGGESILRLLLRGLGQELQKRLGKVETEIEADREQHLIARGNEDLDRDPSSAEASYRSALELNPNSVKAYQGLAAVYKRYAQRSLRPEDKTTRLKAAVNFCNEAIARDPQRGWTFYNRACYKCLAGRDLFPREEVLNDLKRAIELGGEPIKEWARSDKDLEELHSEFAFQNLIPPAAG